MKRHTYLRNHKPHSILKSVFNIIIIIIILLSAVTGCLPKKIDAKLRSAAIKGEISELNETVLSGANVEARDKGGRTVLFAAARAGSFESVKELIDVGANLNAKDNDGKTPLMAGIRKFKIVRILVKKGADVNAENLNGGTALMAAARIGNADTMKFLIANGAKVDAKNRKGMTALMVAAFAGSYDSVNALIGLGADVNAVNNEGQTASMWAAANGHTRVMNLLKDAVAGRYVKKGDVFVKTTTDSAEPVVVAKAANRAPDIEIYEPDITRGIKTVSKKRVRVSGRANDPDGIYEITINDLEVSMGGDGRFSLDVPLAIGENSLTVVATDTKMKSSTKVFRVARERTKDAPSAKASASGDISVGKYYALIVGNNDYKHITKLETARNDATEISKLLKSSYGFETELLLDATRSDILRAMNGFRKKLKENDNFLIYYAGHGDFDKAANKAYWLPVDAEPDDPTNWIIVDDITANIKRISSNHILIVADSCYSGTLTRAAATKLVSGSARDKYLKKMLKRKSRTLISSGGNEPVSDAGGKGHSIFAESFIDGFKTIEMDIFTADEVFYEYIKKRVAGSSEQVPEYNSIRNSGDAGGDFVFIRTK